MADPSSPVPSKNQINKAGKYLRDAHAYPMGKVRRGLASFVNTVGAEGAVSQRHKRVPRIIRKLKRMQATGGGTGLARLEDIGGCRAVLATGSDLDLVRKHIDRQWDGQIVRCRDYIEDPKDMGYRAVHLVVERDDRRIEVQLRTRGQQQWADAVELADGRFGCNLKDEDGPADLVQYFTTSSEIIFLREFGLGVSDETLAKFETARRAVVDAGYYTG